jgi:murein L,D-transpeptidase YcbB/YkuD
MTRKAWVTLIVVLVAMAAVTGRDAAADPLRDAIAARLTAGGGGKVRAGDWEVLRAFYAERAHAPLWLDSAGPSARGRALMDALSRSADDGLAPRAYGLAPSLARRTARSPADGAALELALSGALLRYARAARVGRVPPRIRYHGVTPVALDPAAILHRAAAAADIGAFVADLAPKAPAYRRLRAALKRYRAIAAAGGWPRVPVIKGLAVGRPAPGVTALRRRLAATGDLKSSAAGTAVFDRALAAALRRFQGRHGLARTGRVGAFTHAALNVSIAARIATIELNLERLRWIPDWHADRVVVNAAAFRLRAIRGGKVKLTSAVIVGACHQPTPQFVTWMTGVQFNPYWYVPASIAAREILPRLRRDPGYLRRHGMTVLTGNGRPVDPRTVNWKALKHMPYRLRQRPGPGNALGRIRFLMPNPHNVYLHDTSSPKLFQRRRRAFSHGCIRVARPAELAAFLLEGQPGWDLGAVRRAAAATAQRKVLVDRPIPVFIAYYTAWVAPDGSVQFREDLYRRDRRLAAALRGRN